jgi:hypothetical protein
MVQEFSNHKVSEIEQCYTKIYQHNEQNRTKWYEKLCQQGEQN